VFLLGLFAILFLTALNALPLTFFAMLLVGNLGWSVSFWTLYPGALAFFFAKNSLFNLNLTKTK